MTAYESLGNLPESIPSMPTRDALTQDMLNALKDVPANTISKTALLLLEGMSSSRLKEDIPACLLYSLATIGLAHIEETIRKEKNDTPDEHED